VINAPAALGAGLKRLRYTMQTPDLEQTHYFLTDRKRKSGFVRRAWLVTTVGVSLLLSVGAFTYAGLVTHDSAAPVATAQVSAALVGGDTALGSQTIQTAQTAGGAASPAEAVAAKVSASVVNVRVKGVAVSRYFGQQQYEGVGSGIVYSADGYILTNDHVVSQDGRPADSVQVTLSSGEVLDATIVARDAADDLALLKVDKTGLTPVVFADSSAVRIGQWAIAIGSPLDYSNTVTEGIVSGLDRSLQTGDSTSPSVIGLIQTDAAISPGNSGGGLFDEQGRLIGMPEAYLPPASTGAENMGFAIPADKIQEVALQLSGQPTPGTAL
jgi:S1-C subfamily serine protease